MLTAITSGTRLAYEIHGTGEPVLLIPPAGTRAAVWLTHQVPALVRAGYRAVVFDARGTPPSAVPPPPYRLADLVDDAADLITRLGLAPCRLVGASLGAMVAQELTLARPDLVARTVLLGTRSRTDFFRTALTRAAAARVAGTNGGPSTDFDALMLMMQLFSARTLADERAARDWFTVLKMFPVRGEGPAAQYEATLIPDRTRALAGVRRPCLVVGFDEDVVTPPALCREVAEAIPGSRYVEIRDCGHFGFLERPRAVNAELAAFFAAV